MDELKEVENYQQLPLENKIILFDKTFIRQIHGFNPHQIVLFKVPDNLNFPELVYLLNKEGIVRQEYFFGRKEPDRTSVGDHFSFLDLIEITARKKYVPQPEEIISSLNGQLIGDDKHWIEDYQVYLKAMLK